MPVLFQFDLDTDSVQDANDRTRIQVAFLRLGWEHVGGSAWRYPVIGTLNASEDWFNHVIPAFMYFRSIIEHSGIRVTKFTIESHSSVGHRGDNIQLIGEPIRATANITMYPPNLDTARESVLSENRLKEFIAAAANSLT